MTHNLRNKLAAGTALLALLSALLVPSVAGAQTIDPSPTDDQYGTIVSLSGGGENDDPSGGSGDPPGSAGEASALGSNVGPLPFTGFDVIAMLAVALGVTGLGLGLRRAVSREPEALS